MLPRAGITRVADVTALDRIGIPVWQAVRPGSRNLSVSQGKAVTAAAARVSAAMEAVELWHAECLDGLPTVRASLRQMARHNPFPAAALKWQPDARVLDAAPMEWLPAVPLTAAREAWLPRAMLELDFSLPQTLRPQPFIMTSNGLASGNVLAEALVHGLCELVERHALWLARREPRRRVPLDLDSVSRASPWCAQLLERLRAAHLKLAIYDLTWDAGIPVAFAEVVAPDLPNVWGGAGCHPCPAVAVARALTEACQSRLTYISGVRDDVLPFARDVPDDAAYQAFVAPRPARSLAELADRATESPAGDLALLCGALAAQGLDAWYVDLTRAAIGVPVAYCFVPGLREAPYG